MDDTFTPPYILRNQHLQTILASLRPRKFLLGKRADDLLLAATERILDCGHGVRLLGSFSCHPENKENIVVLIHGWEGSMDSTYLLSAAGMLFDHGFNVFRLNLRDHGNSHHLNRELFNSTRLDEVVNGVAEVFRLFPHKRQFLAGFSLGGNFALRVGLQAPSKDISLDKIVAICPLISPMNTTENLEKNLFVYHAYFVRKWRNSLRKKLKIFPDLGYGDTILARRSLSSMNDYFVPNHTGYTTAEGYLDGYALSGDRLADLDVDTHIVAAQDDPITRIADMALVTARPPSLCIEVTRYGGHCGFLKDYSLKSWADQRLVSLFKEKQAEDVLPLSVPQEIRSKVKVS
ncbi:MAG: alpha/beta fold hydrolase [Desulforhopalus sp.]